MNFENLTFEKLWTDAQRFSIVGNNSYIETYSEFLKYFDSINLIEKHHLIISSHFVYGWMPTIIHINTKGIDRVLPLLNAVKAGHRLELDELEILKSCINNSMVGLSKLLHFINPEEYAIWDSRIYRYISGKKTQYGIDKVKNYNQYLSEIREISQHPGYPDLHLKIEKHFDYPLTSMRAIEILIFEIERMIKE